MPSECRQRSRAVALGLLVRSTRAESTGLVDAVAGVLLAPRMHRSGVQRSPFFRAPQFRLAIHRPAVALTLRTG